MISRKFSDEKIRILKEHYPKGDWETIFEYFPNQKKVNIKSLARRYGVKRDLSDSLSHQDITGNKYGLLTAICFDHKEKNTVYWKCKCDCGNETVVPIYALVKGTTKSCGCLRHKPAVNSIDLTGQRFGTLTALERLPMYKNQATYYKCICDCGNTSYVSSSNLRLGHTVSCENII